MDEAAHRTAWSMCEHLATAHPGAVGVMVKMLKSERTVSEALKTATTRSIEDFELDWRRWVEADAKASK